MRQLKRGDIFEVPLAQSTVGYGQIIIPGDVLYASMLPPNSSHAFVEETNLIEPAVLAWTTDAFFFHERWSVVANADVRADIPVALNKVEIEGQFWIVTYSGERVRRASADDEQCDFRTTIAPIRLQSAISAVHGLSEWQADYDPLTLAWVRERSR